MAKAPWLDAPMFYSFFFFSIFFELTLLGTGNEVLFSDSSTIGVWLWLS
jgi:hypothetical protein